MPVYGDWQDGGQATALLIRNATDGNPTWEGGGPAAPPPIGMYSRLLTRTVSGFIADGPADDGWQQITGRLAPPEADGLFIYNPSVQSDYVYGYSRDDIDDAGVVSEYHSTLPFFVLSHGTGPSYLFGPDPADWPEGATDIEFEDPSNGYGDMTVTVATERNLAVEASSGGPFFDSTRRLYAVTTQPPTPGWPNSVDGDPDYTADGTTTLGAVNVLAVLPTDLVSDATGPGIQGVWWYNITTFEVRQVVTFSRYRFVFEGGRLPHLRQLGRNDLSQFVSRTQQRGVRPGPGSIL